MSHENEKPQSEPNLRISEATWQAGRVLGADKTPGARLRWGRTSVFIPSHRLRDAADMIHDYADSLGIE